MLLSLRSERSKSYALSAPATPYIGLPIILPPVLMVAHGFWTQEYIEIDRTFTLENYRQAFTDPLIRLLIVTVPLRSSYLLPVFAWKLVLGGSWS